jgi:hypothetical protein
LRGGDAGRSKDDEQGQASKPEYLAFEYPEHGHGGFPPLCIAGSEKRMSTIREYIILIVGIFTNNG